MSPNKPCLTGLLSDAAVSALWTSAPPVVLWLAGPGPGTLTDYWALCLGGAAPPPVADVCAKRSTTASHNRIILEVAKG